MASRRRTTTASIKAHHGARSKDKAAPRATGRHARKAPLRREGTEATASQAPEHDLKLELLRVAGEALQFLDDLVANNNIVTKPEHVQFARFSEVRAGLARLLNAIDPKPRPETPEAPTLAQEPLEDDR